MTLDDTQKTTEERTNKLVLKTSVNPSKSDTVSGISLIKKAPLTYNMVQKRWLTEGFGFCRKKKQQKESRKWLIDNQLSGPNSPPSTNVIQDPWMGLRKRNQSHQEGHLTDFKTHRKVSAGARVSARKQSLHKPISLQQKHIDNIPKLNVDETLFRGSNRTHNEGNNMGSLVVLEPENHSKTFGYSKELPPLVNPPVWNKSYDPTWGRYLTSFEGIESNPLKDPYRFHDGSSSIKWYNAPNYGWARTSEPPLNIELIQNDDSFSLAKEPVNFDGIMERKVVAKSKDKSKFRKFNAQGRSNSKYELIPKIYTLKNEKTKNQNYDDRYGWSAKMAPNPIVIPGFKRKHTDAPSDDNEHVSRRPYTIHAEQRKASFDDDFVQVSRDNQNQTKNMESIKDNSNAGVPIQLPPYGFPGGVNISILVPNPAAAAFHETPPRTMTSSSTNKYGKNKKERKSKDKTDYDSLKNLLSEPRSLVSAGNRKSPHVDRHGIKLFRGDDDRRVTGQQLISYRPQQNNLIGNMNHPMFNLQPENLSLLRHIKNLTLNQLDWESPLFRIQTEKIEKPSHYSEDEDDNDEIQVLYDEQTSSSTLLSDKNAQIGQAVSFSWDRFTDYPAQKSSARDVWQNGKFCTPSNVEQVLGNGSGGSGRLNPGVAKYLNVEPRSIGSENVENKQSFRRSATKGRNCDRESEAIPIENCRHHKNGYFNDKSIDSVPRDQWDALDETLKSEIREKVNDVAWQARNRKREVDYENQLANDEQGYYRLSLGENSFRNPTNLVMSVFRAKPNKHRARDYYDDIPEEPIREGMRSNVVGSPHHH